MQSNIYRGAGVRNFFAVIDAINVTAEFCTAIYQDPIFHQLMKINEEKFDLIVTDGLAYNDCVFPLVGVHKVPLVAISTMLVPGVLNSIDSPQAYDHFPFAVSSFTDEMNLFQRTLNGILGLTTILIRNWMLLPTVDRIAKDLLGHEIDNLKSALEIEEEFLSLVIAKVTPGVMYGLPKSANLVEAGGLHCVPSKPLPDDLEAFVNNSGDDGFIVVSFGSILKGSRIPENVRRIFLNTFGRLRQRVIWKWEDDENSDSKIEIPSNVKLMSWLPQQDLLGHPKARLFITHAGLASIEETVYHGVPLIALPVAWDQPWNAEKIHKDGCGIRLDWDNLSEEVLYDSIQEILRNPK